MDKNELEKVDILGKGNEDNLNRFALFFAKTIDKIVDQNLVDRVFPCELFEIANLITKKMKDAN